MSKKNVKAESKMDAKYASVLVDMANNKDVPVEKPLFGRDKKHRKIVISESEAEPEPDSTSSDEEESQAEEHSEEVEKLEEHAEERDPTGSFFMRENAEVVFNHNVEAVQDLKAQANGFFFTLWEHNIDLSMDPMVPNSLGRFKAKLIELTEKKPNPAAPTAEYILVGPREICPSSQKPHRHGILYLSKRRQIKWLVQYFGFPQSLRFLVQLGSRAAGRVYCLKELREDNPVFLEFGEVEKTPAPKGPGKREQDRWAAAYAACKEPELDLDKIPPQIAINAYKNLVAINARFNNQRVPKRLSSPCGIFLFGPPNTGKSYFARNGEGRTPEDCGSMMSKTANNFFDGCDTNKYIILEEVGTNFREWDALKEWTDVNPFTANLKGSHTKIRPLAFICTSNYHLDSLFPITFTSAHRKAINRRFRFLFFYREYDEDNDDPYYVEVMSYKAAELPSMEEIFQMVPLKYRAAARRLWDSADTGSRLGTLSIFNSPDSDSAFTTPVQKRQITDHRKSNAMEVVEPTQQEASSEDEGGPIGEDPRGTQAPEVTPECCEGPETPLPPALTRSKTVVISAPKKKEKKPIRL